MKIVKAEIFGIHLPLKEPFIISYASYDYMPSIIVRLETDNGLEGYGEAVPDEHVTGESFHSTISMLKHTILPALIGFSPINMEKLHQKMNELISSNPSAKAAVDIACYDLLGKYKQEPVYNLLGGQYHDTLTYPKVLSIEEPDLMARKAKNAIDQGYQSLKLKVGTSYLEDCKRIAHVREQVGMEIPIRVDVNQGWRNVSTALQAIKLLEHLNISWVEQPIKMGDIHGLGEIRQKTSTPLMADESIHAGEDLVEIIRNQAADKINIKLMKCGGIYPAIHMAKAAEYAGIECQIGSMVESSIGSAAGYHAAISRKNIISTELTGPLLFSKDIGDLKYDIPYVHLSDKPGLGIKVNEDVLKELTIQYDSIEKG
ncbi:L-alanine-DL-glutamate epimerase-like enolase superfamily enzyme [Cytobacillus oceanisediminis]|uniref:Dipeptide epimerase n=1 Tax=Cytobacillus oceanisediminis TaxID=665099 RepID=A0A2V3A3Q5_9BACI|nr:dipeptide epimerase [Cytobacillus oceanisediminis]PWW31456.1 L-alanine-DL-glutamate epimerase-like enolase superfamily enzyme [Cytobacillus oceanisediminis]